MLRDSTPRFVGPSVRPLVRPLFRHTLLFLGFCGFWPYCSCPNDLVTSIMAPAHPHKTGVAVYPALLFNHRPYPKKSIWSLKAETMRKKKTRFDKSGHYRKLVSFTSDKIHFIYNYWGWSLFGFNIIKTPPVNMTISIGDFARKDVSLMVIFLTELEIIILHLRNLFECRCKR